MWLRWFGTSSSLMVRQDKNSISWCQMWLDSIRLTRWVHFKVVLYCTAIAILRILVPRSADGWYSDLHSQFVCTNQDMILTLVEPRNRIMNAFVDWHCIDPTTRCLARRIHCCTQTVAVDPKRLGSLVQTNFLAIFVLDHGPSKVTDGEVQPDLESCFRVLNEDPDVHTTWNSNGCAFSRRSSKKVAL